MNDKRRRIILVFITGFLLLTIVAAILGAVLGISIWNRNTKVELAGDKVIDLKRKGGKESRPRHDTEQDTEEDATDE